VRALGWNYDDSTLYRPRENTEAAALYLDILSPPTGIRRWSWPNTNGGPLNAGFFRAGVDQLKAGDQDLRSASARAARPPQGGVREGVDPQLELMQRNTQREGKDPGRPSGRGSSGPRRGTGAKADPLISASLSPRRNG